MTTRDTAAGEVRPRATHALLAAALLAATALVRVPTELYRASAQDFASASRDLLLAVFAAGFLLFVLLALVVACLPARLRGYAGPPLVGVAAYAWIRSGFFPGPSVNLDGSRLTADLSTGPAGLPRPPGGGGAPGLAGDAAAARGDHAAGGAAGRLARAVAGRRRLRVGGHASARPGIPSRPPWSGRGTGTCWSSSSTRCSRTCSQTCWRPSPACATSSTASATTAWPRATAPRPT